MTKSEGTITTDQETQRAAIEGWQAGPHRFRHTTCTKLIRARKSSSVVRPIMGHAHIATTEIYVNPTSADLREQHHTASPVESIGSLRSPVTRKHRLSRR